MSSESKSNLYFIPTKDVFVPGVITSILVGKPKSINSVKGAINNGNGKILLFAQKDNTEGTDNLYGVGVLADIMKSSELPEGFIRVMVEIHIRVKLLKVIESNSDYRAEYQMVEDEYGGMDNSNITALRNQVIKTFEKYVKVRHHSNYSLLESINKFSNTSRLLDFISANISVVQEKKQRLVSAINVETRGLELLSILNEEIEIISIENSIENQAMKNMNRMQRKYVIKEKIKALKSELSNDDLKEDTDSSDEIQELREKIRDLNIPEKSLAQIEKEIDRLSKFPIPTAEYSCGLSYLTVISELPWNKETRDRLDIKKVKKELDRDHFGLEEVKERIEEVLSICKLKGKSRISICFVGPPGVGKTTISKSISRALNREFVKISLGGIKDEAELSGHRRTYVGSLPGKIINGLKNAGVKNPVMLFDEIDKIASDVYRGDPASILLSVLDEEQNKEFNDLYLGVPFDISEVFFISTANDIDKIPNPLKDRLEIIKIDSYTDMEKLKIAKYYLIPKVKINSGLNKLKYKISDEDILFIIHNYTRESGVRELKRVFEKLFRKIASNYLKTKMKSVNINRKLIDGNLGFPKYLDNFLKKDSTKIGNAIGLAWTPFGGSVLEIQTTLMGGKKKLELTGSLGNVMKDSALIARNFIRSNFAKFGIDEDIFDKKDLHIHVPDGATPKDGPSAGITLVTSLLSTITSKPIRQNIAMTGEVDIHGNILMVGGIREKVLGAYRNKIKEIILPKDNERDLQKIPVEIKNKMIFHFVDNYDKVMEIIFS